MKNGFTLPRDAKNTGLFVLSFFILAGVMVWDKSRYDWTLVLVTTFVMFIAGFFQARHRGESLLEGLLFGLLIGCMGFAGTYLGTLNPEIHNLIRVICALGVTSLLWTFYHKRLYPISSHLWAAIFGFLSANSVVQYLWRTVGVDLWIAVVIGFASFLALQAIAQSKETIPASQAVIDVQSEEKKE